jgi:hypothetical protein
VNYSALGQPLRRWLTDWAAGDVSTARDISPLALERDDEPLHLVAKANESARLRCCSEYPKGVVSQAAALSVALVAACSACGSASEPGGVPSGP